MNEDKTFAKKLESFLSGKGFYIVLFICVAVIGVSAWALLFNGTVDSENEGSALSGEPEKNAVDVMAPQSGTVTEKPAAKEPEDAEKTFGKDAAEETPSPAEDAPPAETADSTDAGDDGGRETVFIWPLSGEIDVAYSMDKLIYDRTMADWRTHNGVDIASEVGTRVLAAADGTVEEVYDDDLLGTTVVIDHGSGITSRYSNLASIPTVEEGDTVTMGSVIGAVGDTAIAETVGVPHLHFAMTCGGEPADPAEFLPKR